MGKVKFKTFSEELTRQLKELSQEELEKEAYLKRLKNSISLRKKLKNN